MMQIRSMTDTDQEAVIALWNEVGLTRPWNDPARDIAAARQGPTSDILVGTDEAGTIIATVMVGNDGHRGAVYYLTVAPHRRGEGLGRVIMQAAETWLSEHGAWKINLLVRDENTAVLGFYDSIGYTSSGVAQLGKWLTDD